jgi:hypothetical protein
MAAGDIVSVQRQPEVRFDINFDINCPGRPWMLVDGRQPKTLEIEYARGEGGKRASELRLLDNLTSWATTAVVATFLSARWAVCIDIP